MPAKKPEGWKDILDYIGKQEKQKAKTWEKRTDVNKKAAKQLFGDPSKGWKDVATNTGAWLIPYGKGFKVVNAAVKGAKYYKTAKVSRGALKTGTVIAGNAVLSKGVNALPDRKKTAPKKVVPKKLPRK